MTPLALEGASLLELLTVFGAGVATLATPCILPLVPIYFGMLLGGSAQAAQQPGQRWRLLGMTAAFGAGFVAVFALLGLGASFLGGLLNAYRAELTLLGAGLIVLFGFKFAGWLRLPWLDRDLRAQAPRRIEGPLGGFLFGAVFGLGWTPCAGPVLASVLSYTALQGQAVQGAAMLALYGAGVALPLLGVAAFADRALPLLRRLLPHLEGLQRATGVLMIGLGLFVGAGAWQQLTPPSQQPLSAVTVASVELEPLLGAPSERPRLLELMETDCPVCQRMAARVEALQQDCGQQLVDVHTIDLEQEPNRGLRQALGVQAVPTFVLVDASGAVRATLVGERSMDELRGLAATLQGESCAGVAPLQVDALEQGAGCSDEIVDEMGAVAGGVCG